jgi:secondary thiamine-phosphate synthase enzyme
MEIIPVKTSAHSQAVDITGLVQKALAGSGKKQGWCEVFVPHTTAGVAVNEAADPAVMQDVLDALERLAPWRGNYRHAEGNAAAHVKSVLVGSTVRVPVKDGRLALGAWQGIFFLEFDGPRSRQVWVDMQGV